MATSSPFRHQAPAYSPAAIGDLLRALRSLGDRSAMPRRELEKLLGTRYGADEVLLVGSGTQALQLAIRTSVGPGGRVALPSFACFDVGAAAVGADARILLYDLDPETLGPDMPSLRRALHSGASAVVVAPLFGVPPDWDAIREICDEHGARLIEDAAQGHGGSYRDRPLGSLGEVSVLSFGRGKGWNGGGGGAALFRTEARIPAVDGSSERSRSPAAVARVAAESLLSHPRLYGIPAAMPWLRLGETLYHHPVPPALMGSPNAALAVASHRSALAEAEHRRCVGRSYNEALRRRSGIAPAAITPGAEAGYLRFPVRLSGSRFADSAWLRRARRAGIVRSYPAPLTSLNAVREILVDVPTPANIAGAEVLARELFTLPTHSRLTSADVGVVLRLLHS